MSTRGAKQIALIAASTPEAREACARLEKRYGNVEPKSADVIVALGGDGLMLQTMHNHLGSRIPIYGMNRGSVGFLLNDYREDELVERLDKAEINVIHPLRMTAYDRNRAEHKALAINDGHVDVPERPGLGIDVDEKRLRRRQQDFKRVA